MSISQALKVLYASGGDEVRIQTLTLEMPSGEHVRLVQSYYPEMLGIDGVMHEFEPVGMEIDLPTKDDSGNQTLKFAIGFLEQEERINGMIDAAIESGSPVYLVYREYISTDKSAPAMAPIRMTVQGGVFDIDELGLEGSYFDMLNAAWPRERYTIELAPGVKYQ